MPRAQSAAPPKPKPKPQSRLSRAKSAAPSKPKSKYNENREYSHATKSDEEEYVPKDKCPGVSPSACEYEHEGLTSSSETQNVG